MVTKVVIKLFRSCMATRGKHFVPAAMSPRPSVHLMARVERPAIEAHIGAKPTDLDKPLRGVAATFAEAHERTEPEFVGVAVMRLNVIADCRRLDDAGGEALEATAP
jgi:hypothetical protein